MKYYIRLYIFFIVTIFLSILYLYHSVSMAEEKLYTNFENTFMQEAQCFAENIETMIKREIPENLYATLRNDPIRRESMQNALSLLVTPIFKYVYVLYRDKNGKYRYLLDGSKEERGEFDEPFAVDTKRWDPIYEKGTPGIIKQQNLETLWGTYLKPIRYDGRTEGIIVIDFSMKLPSSIAAAMEPIKSIFLYIFLSIIALILVMMWQSFLSLKSKRESITDELTQMYNRSFLRDFLKNYDLFDYQILMLDIDHFKAINDNYGHKAGDFILREVSKIIKRSIREEDIPIRFGGEEFLIFVKRERKKSSIAQIVARRIKESIEKKEFSYEGHPIRLTVSIGIVLYPERYKTASAAIKKADELLYRAKREGRNKIISEMDTPHNDKETETVTIHHVKEALEENRIVCHYQPIVNLENGQTLKYEALVRLIDKEGKIVPPMKFLKTIEYTNIYNDLTKRVIEIVFDAIEKNRVSISINLNLSDILDNVIYTGIVDTLERNSALARWLTIELLEYESDFTEILKERIDEIRSFGTKIALDDFGSGYSNFSIFQKLTIDILKIDGSLIKELENSDIAKTITESIVMFSKKLKIETVAEFIHNEKTLEIVKSLGVTEGQGFYLGKPSPTIDPSNRLTPRAF